MNKSILLGFSAVLLLGACTFPGQYFDQNPPAGKESLDAQSGVDYIMQPIDASTIAQLNKVEKAASANIAEPTLSKVKLSTSANQTAPVPYVIGAGDMLKVTVWDHPELTNPAGITTGQDQGRLVQPDGTFYFPFLGNVKAAGRTTEEIRVEMTKNLEKYLRSPQLDVAVAANGFRSQKFYVSGEVKTPGFFPVTDIPVTLSDAISQAGGVSPNADLSDVALQRGGNTYHLNLYGLYYNGDLSQNVFLKNGDVINLPDRRLRKVFVMGEVIKPSSVVMPVGKLTLAEVLSDIGGLNQNTANAGQVYVIRQSDQPAPVGSTANSLMIYHLDSSSPTSILFADQFDLLPRDLVYVDPTKLVRVNRLLGNILPSLQFLPTVRSNLNVLEGK